MVQVGVNLVISETGQVRYQLSKSTQIIYFEKQLLFPTKDPENHLEREQSEVHGTSLYFCMV